MGRDRHETPLERADRNFGELLQELRVTQTGVQILFAFLLTLAFTPRFPALDGVQRATYIATLLLAVLAAALFTAPAALHRALFGRGAKPQIVQMSSRLAAVGLGVLMLALAGSVLLVVDVTAGGRRASRPGRARSRSVRACGACCRVWCGAHSRGRRRRRAPRPRSRATAAGLHTDWTGTVHGRAIHTVLPPSGVGLTDRLPPHSEVRQRMITMPRPLSCWTAAGSRFG